MDFLVEILQIRLTIKEYYCDVIFSAVNYWKRGIKNYTDKFIVN